MSEQSNVLEFIPREDYERQMEETFHSMAQRTKNLKVPNEGPLSRKRVVSAFMDCFDMIGGLPRLAVWANENETDFYKLYARLLPSQASAALDETNELVIKHIIPRTVLDESS